MTTPRHEYAARCRWTLARLGELINEARAIGWLSGSVIDDVEDSSSLSLESGDETPMGLLAQRLELSRQQVDIVWLLACIELEPALSSAARSLIGGGMTELSVQILEQLVAADVGLDPEALARLLRFGLIETTYDQRIPLFRRPIRASDRVLDLARGRLALDSSLRHVATLLRSNDGVQNDVQLPRELQRQIENDVVVVASGSAGTGRTTMLRRLAHEQGRAVLVIGGGSLPTEEGELRRQLRALARECHLHEAWPLIQEVEALRERMPPRGTPKTGQWWTPENRPVVAATPGR